MNIVTLDNSHGLYDTTRVWGIEIGRDHVESYFFGLFKKKTTKWALWRKYTSRTKMLEALEMFKETSRYQFRSVQVKYK